MQSSSLLRVDGRTAFVTGASSGLGVVFAEALAEAGANVVLAARRVDRLQAVAQRIEDTGRCAMAIRCDVGDAAQVENAVAQACKRFGRIDILVNNAGIAAEGFAVPEKVSDEAFESTMRVNLFGTWYCSRSVGTRMLADGRGGSIINITSVAGLGATPDFPVAYHTSKAAIINLTRSLGASWADRGVRVNAIAPGWFITEINEAVLAHPDFRQWAEACSAMNRLGDTRELVGVLLFLASDASTYVTAQTIAVDGGTTASVGVSRIPESFRTLVAEQVPGGLAKRIEPKQADGVAAD